MWPRGSFNRDLLCSCWNWYWKHGNGDFLTKSNSGKQFAMLRINWLHTKHRKTNNPLLYELTLFSLLLHKNVSRIPDEFVLTESCCLLLPVYKNNVKKVKLQPNQSCRYRKHCYSSLCLCLSPQISMSVWQRVTIVCVAKFASTPRAPFAVRERPAVGLATNSQTATTVKVTNQEFCRNHIN